MVEEREKQILKLLKKDISLEEMMEQLSMTKEELWSHLTKLQIEGYQIQKKHDTRKITYKLNREPIIKETNPITIYHKKEHLKLLILSDLHLGSKEERIDLLWNMHQYAIDKGIENTLIAGDFIDGIYEENKESRFENVKEQLEYAKDAYPFHDNMHNYILLGNHDFHSVKREGFDPTSYLERIRSDFTIVGYRLNYLKIRNLKIALFHPFVREDHQMLKEIKKESDIILQGHSHRSKIENKKDPYHISLPGLIDHSFGIPGAIIMNLNWNHYELSSCEIELFEFPSTWKKRQTTLIKMKK